jgi:hypothetical protein
MLLCVSRVALKSTKKKQLLRERNKKIFEGDPSIKGFPTKIKDLGNDGL